MPKKFRLNGIRTHDFCDADVGLYALVIGFPEGGGPRADVGEYGDFMGTLQQISALVVGEMWGLRLIF